MTGRPASPAEPDGLAFFGRITASVTHELNNVLSVIDQARGLLEDLTAMSGDGREIDPRSLESIRDRIHRQVSKGVEILRRVNRFAHTLDDPGAEFDVGAETDNVVSLARRFAELREVHLELEPPPEEIRVRGNAFAFQHGIFACLQRILDDSEGDDRIGVRVGREGDEAVVAIATSAHLADASDDDERLRPLADSMTSLGGAHRVRPEEGGGTRFELHFPVTRTSVATGESEARPGG
jgi:signal transduction histidine kinase